MIPVHAKPHKGLGTIGFDGTALCALTSIPTRFVLGATSASGASSSRVAARPQYEPHVTWRPFELNPELPPEGVDRAAYLAARVGDPRAVAEAQAELMRHGAASGIEFRFDLIQRMPNTRRSHLLIAHAARSGRQAAVKERIMRAYFEEGCDIGDIEELVRLGVEAGLRRARGPLCPGPALRPGRRGGGRAPRGGARHHRRSDLHIRRPVHDLGRPGSGDPRPRPRSGGRICRGPRRGVVNEGELTGQARTHIVEVEDPPCALHAQVVAALFESAPRGTRRRLRFDTPEQLSRFLAAIDDLERRNSAARGRCSTRPARRSRRRNWRRPSASRRSCCGRRCRARAGITGARMSISSIVARSRRGYRVQLTPEEFAPAARSRRLPGGWNQMRAIRFFPAVSRRAVGRAARTLAFQLRAGRRERAPDLTPAVLRRVIAAAPLLGKEEVLGAAGRAARALRRSHRLAVSLEL